MDGPAGMPIWFNAHWKRIFQLDPVPARYLGAKLGGLLPEERIEAIITAQKGRCIGMWGTEVQGLYVSPTGMEWQALITPRDSLQQQAEVST